MLELTEEKVLKALPKIVRPLEKYLWLQSRAAELKNPEVDEEFCRRFSGFYRLRARDAAWRRAYFALMGEVRGTAPDFRTCLTRLHAMTGRVEASFASKLLATLNPTLPVLDSVVLGHLSLKLPAWNATDRIEKSAAIYGRLTDRMVEYVHSAGGGSMIAAFRGYSDDFRRAAVTDMKIVDLVLWQMR
ncbi:MULTISPECIES: hypothetical protein [Bradyrhizobium]|uniref:hypothetical protein n=1 Tax=Bradyrhizobium elkanii TaxID=29448 RepID=UPI002714D0B1|nr:hypothetical protein [Bradyrhizobium elkanii]WLA47303.1 hypothetical protein QIH80_37370 [Bradyrhizobium elkanii]WLB82401.1 hypothetical protein QIH83_07405 [Bradyrhizobium elkanii]